MIKNMSSPSRRSGTTLIEILVVIVIFLVGILAIVQIFPGGYKILSRTRDIEVADSLVKGQMDAMKGDPTSLPSMILPVITGTANIDPNRSTLDSSIYDEGNVTANNDGTITYNGVNYSDYHYYAGANVFRHIVDEPFSIPAPNSASGFAGGLVSLHYGPTRQLGANEQTPIFVRGSNYVVNQGTPSTGILAYGQSYISGANDPNGTLSIQIDDATTNPQFLISMAIYTQLAGTTYRRNVVNVLAGSGGLGTISGQYLVLNLSALATGGETYVAIDPSSVQVQRIFEQLAPTATFSQTDPYQYKVLSTIYGQLLFNPIAYNYQLLAADGQRKTLQGYVSYDVLDWQIQKDRVRLSNDEQEYKLSLNSLLVMNNTDVSGLPYKGLPLPDVNVSNATIPSDIVFVDQLTGGLVLYDPVNQTNPADSSISVNKSDGTFTVNNFTPGSTAPTIMVFPPDPTTTTGYGTGVVVPANDRVVTAMYRAKGVWANQPIVNPALYYETTKTPGYAQYELGAGTRIYFPPMDVGTTVSLNDFYYVGAGGTVQEAQGQSFQVRNTPSDPNGPYIDLRDYDSNATALDFSHGYAVRGVHGATVAVRMTVNPDAFRFTNVSADSLTAFDKYRQSERHSKVETFIPRGTN